MARPQSVLVAILGPVAAGKSTLATEVAEQLRARGESVALVGLDSVGEMASPTLDWAWAHEVHGRLVQAWLATPVGIVVAEGPSTPAELDVLMRYVESDVEVLTAVLATPYEVALARASQDADRGVSKDPEFLRSDHDRFLEGLANIKHDLNVDGATATPAELAERVLSALDDRRDAPP